VPVIGGFVGATPGGVTTTLGRGGSDYTAAIVAACLDAGELQIWSDVDGVLSADPRLVGEARPVSRLSFAEASELASFGARVLHPDTVQPAIARGIPVRVRNSRRPQGEGTLILPGCPDRDTLLAGLACRHPVTVIEAGTRHHGPFRGLLGRVIEAAQRSGASLALVTTSGTAVTLVVDQTATAAALAGTLAGFADVTVRRDRALLCAVGDGVAARAAFTAELLSAIAPAVVELVTHAAGGRGVIAIVAAHEAAAAMARAHGCFLEAPRAALAS
jgi:aspartate kinase